MNRTRISTMSIALMLTFTLAGAVLSAVGGPAQAASRGYQVYNLSSYQLQLDRVIQVPIPGRNAVYSMDFEGRPANGSVLKPGEAAHDWELKYSVVDQYAAYLIYNIVGTKETFRATIHTYPTTNESSCTIPASIGSCTAEGLTLTFTDPPGTVHVIGAGNAQKQADTLRDLCKKSNSASCDFSPTKEERINAPARLVGDPIVNCQRHKVVSKLSYSDTVGQSNSVGTEVGVEVETNLVFAKAKASVTAKYEHEWTEKHEFGQEVEIDVEPGDMAWVAATSPIYRDTGDFTLTLGKTTWKLTDVYFDTADPKRTAMFLPDERALTPAEYKQMCTHVPPNTKGLLRAPVAWVSLHRVGSDDHDRMVGGRESTTLRGVGGNDTLIGGASHDGLFGGSGRDHLYGDRGHDLMHGGSGRDVLTGGPGNDVLRGGHGADTMIDKAGTTRVVTGASTGSGRDYVDVRDGRSDDLVRCTTKHTVIVADPGDTVRGRCGKVLRNGPGPDRFALPGRA
jgi:hypothetical protein